MPEEKLEDIIRKNPARTNARLNDLMLMYGGGRGLNFVHLFYEFKCGECGKKHSNSFLHISKRAMISEKCKYCGREYLMECNFSPKIKIISKTKCIEKIKKRYEDAKRLLEKFNGEYTQ